MFFCLRVDLDYVPWDTPDAADFGHGEPAVLLRLLELAKTRGIKLHCFASGRVLRAFPAACDAILNEGHDLDWLCKHPAEMNSRWTQAEAEFRRMGHDALGFASRDLWPDDLPVSGFQFFSGPKGAAPPGVRHFPMVTRPDREAARAGQSARVWTDGIRKSLRDLASLQRDATVAIRPQVLGRIDPSLHSIRELLDLATALSFRPKTLRDAFKSEAAEAP